MSVTSSYRILRAEHTSYDGIEWRVDIHDSLAASENTRTTNLSSEGVTIKMQGRQMLYDWIHPTTAEFELMVNSQDVEDTLLAFADSSAQRYFAFIYREGARVFVGMITNETVDIEDAPFPYKYKITAIDGLAVLKDQEYSSTLGVAFTGRQELSRMITIALGMMPTAGFYDDESPPDGGFMLYTGVRWYEENMPDTSKDPLEWTRVDHKLWDKRDEFTDEPEFYTAWEVLEKICIRFAARLFYWDGSYWFVQPDIFVSSASFTAFRYLRGATNSTGSISVSDEHDIYDATNTASNKGPKTGGRFTHYRGLKTVRIKHLLSHYNFLKDYEFSSGGTNTPMTITGLDTTSGSLTLIIGGRIWARVYDNALPENVRFYNQYGGPDDNDYSPAHLILQFRIQVGSYYLKREATGRYGNLSWEFPGLARGEWTTTPSYFEVFSDPFTDNGQEMEIDMGCLSPPIPDDGTQDLTFSFEGFEYWKPAGHPGTDPPAPEWELFDGGFWLKDINNPFKVKKYSETIATNSNSNTGEDKYELPFADDARAWSVDRMTIWDGTSWGTSALWKVNLAGTAYNINELFVRTLASLQKLPMKVRSGGFIRPYVKPYSRLNYLSEIYIPIQYSANSETDEVEGDFIVLRQDSTNITVDTIISEIARPDRTKVNYTQAGAPSHSIYTGLEGVRLKSWVDAGAVSTLEIIAPGYDSFRTGDIIRIIDLINGNSETLEVTADVGAADTTISVTGTLTHQYNVDSKIFLDPNWLASVQPRPTTIKSANFDNVTAAFVSLASPTSGDTITAPDSDTLTAAEINKVFKVWRNGVKQRYRGDYSGAFTDYGYKIDDDNERVYFFPELDGEDIEIEAI